jgi:sRNA-binding carbon storage regulator CsrA
VDLGSSVAAEPGEQRFSVTRKEFVPMLCLGRKVSQEVVIRVPAGPAREIVVTLIEVRGSYIREGYTADKEVEIHRRESLDKKGDAS